MMNRTLSQALSNNLFSPQISSLCETIYRSFTVSEEKIFVILSEDIASLRRLGKRYFKSYTTIADKAGVAYKTVQRAMDKFRRYGLIINYDENGFSISNDTDLSEFGLKFIWVMREKVAYYYKRFTKVLIQFGTITKNIFSFIFNSICPTSKQKLITINTDSQSSSKKRMYKSCCLINCEDEECILPRERGVMEIERLRRGETGGPSPIKLLQNHAANDSTTHPTPYATLRGFGGHAHQREKRGDGTIPGSVDTGLYQLAQPVKDTNDKKKFMSDLKDIEKNEEYVATIRKLLKLGIIDHEVYIKMVQRMAHDFKNS